MANPVTLAFMAASTAFSVGSQISKGNAERASADSQAKQMEANAARAMQEGRSRADEEKRQTARLMSDAQAIQGASGFSASDAQALKQVGDISGAGKYNELSYIYEARQDAEGMIRGAKYSRESGRAKQRAARLGAVSSAFSGASDIWSSPAFNPGTGGTVPVRTSQPVYTAGGATAYGAGPRGPAITRRRI
mgnify:CR=1 FL=1